MRKNLLTSTAVLPFVLLASATIGTATVIMAICAPVARASSHVKNPCNPCAAKNPCNPCAAQNPCNPCAAKNPCNPCAAQNPCSPCAASAVSSSSACLVPRLAAAAQKPGNPCAAKNPCSPCAAQNPCNPCAAQNPCNPCAAQNPCNPCAAQNPCNPCAAQNPCNPCAAAEPPELTDAEVVAIFDCINGEMQAAYAKSDNPLAQSYAAWQYYSRQPYQSGTHGSRYVVNQANATGRAYGNFEKAGIMPVGTAIAKPSFTVSANGRGAVGPLFLMEKMPAGFNADSGDWRYTMIMPSGQVVGTTNGPGSSNMVFCADCHKVVAEDQDNLYFLPDEYRLN